MPDVLSAILVDDEEDSLIAISEQLSYYCPKVKILGTYSDSLEGLEAIQQLQPDIAFLDIRMPKMNGLELASRIDTKKTNIVFVTAYGEYAIHAIRLSAMDYLEKPVVSEDLQAAIERIAQKIGDGHGEEQEPQGQQSVSVLNTLMDNQQKESFSQETTIRLSDDQMVLFVQIKDIIRLQAERNCCRFFIADNSPMLVSKNLGSFKDGLSKYNFVQVHRSHMVNRSHIRKYIRADGGTIELSNGEKVPVSDSYRNKLF